MQNQAKVALRKQIKKLVKETTLESRKLQSNSITQKVKLNIIQNFLCIIEIINSMTFTAPKPSIIPSLKTSIDLSQHGLRSQHN